ncbi:branched-chain amino acid ABC transporter permease [Caballeronia sp. LZ008]|uniref:branched-chain amino acid ABC transporter permease n=1 Tax=unclassified Caballeronia TaxID=2646786 RepID=UPI0020282472|nr:MULTISPECIES: branched-chain amino acid ABC transporter permease [unclassified Caballeronia]MDR5798138.1 branched-chain amino acid ABC transporter permease [Caballeronia sp. LZ008]
MRKFILLAILVAAAVAPWIIGGRYILHIATMVVLTIPLALSVNLTLKLDQLSLAQPAFMGVGAYASALLTMRLGVPPVLALLSGGLLAIIISLVFGPIFLRIKGVYFVLLTYAFSQVVNLIFQEWTSLFGGNNGLYGIPRFSILGWSFDSIASYYALGLVVAAIFFVAMLAVERSDMGAIFGALNEDESFCRSIGSNAHSWRVAAFVMSSFMAAIAGGLYAFYIGFISPDVFGFQATIDLIVMNVVGGSGVVLGPVLGALVIVPLLELLREAKEYQLLVYGFCLIFFVLFFRQGIVSLFVRRRGAA